MIDKNKAREIQQQFLEELDQDEMTANVESFEREYTCCWLKQEK